MAQKKKKLVLIDGNALIHRAYHALPPLTTKKGELVNAVFGFSSVFLKVINELKPDYILATFDLKGPTFRHLEYQDYKANRIKAPDELYAQIGRVKEMLRAFSVPIYEKEGFEADDIIGTLVFQSEKQAERQGEERENIIVTGDLDTLQLVSPKTKVYALRRGMGDEILYDEEGIKKRFKLSPWQMIDFKGLRGDPSDNIPGVKGIGEKTAQELLAKFNSLENVYQSLEKIKPTLREKLEKDRLRAFLSKKLATINKKAPVELVLEEAITQDFDQKKIVAFFQELGFFSLIKRLLGNFEGLGKEKKKKKNLNFKIVSQEEKKAFFEKLLVRSEVAFRLQIFLEAGRKPFLGTIWGVSFCWESGKTYFLEWKKEDEKRWRDFFESPQVRKVGYDLKKEKEVLRGVGINLNLGDFSSQEERGLGFDVMLAAYVLDPGSQVNLGNLVLRELGEEWEEPEPSGQLKLMGGSLTEEIKKVCCQADYCWKLKNIYEEKIRKISQKQAPGKNLENIFKKLEMPLVEVLAEMEISGIKFHKLIFQGISEKIEKNIKNLEKSIFLMAGEEFNLNSPKQVGEILFQKLKIPTEKIKKLKTGFSTASGELLKLKGEYKIVEKIEEYRELFKLKTTYLDTLPALVDARSRIHSDFNQAVTATGRLSSSEPNLQNIPIRSDLGRLLRTAFVAEEGNCLVSADYSQIDLRVVAHVSQDKKMMEVFRKNEDIHRSTAAQVNKISPSQVTEKMRRAAKVLNFGIIYGMSVFGFSESAGIEREEARKFIDEYMNNFSGVAAYIRTIKEEAKKDNYVETELGRRRYLPEINSPNFQLQNAAERMAINMPIQGLAADIMKLAMLKIFEEFKSREEIKIILQIHDEIILEVKEAIASEVAKTVKEIMEKAYPLKVPLVAKVKIGQNWGEV